MATWISYSTFVLFSLAASISLFFFVVTRGALLARALSPNAHSDTAHIYPVYSNMQLIKLVDFQPIISAILLFQYDSLVSKIVAQLAHTDLKNKKVMITSCAFGNVIPRVVEAALKAGAEKVLVVDLIQNELTQAKSKLTEFPGKVEFIKDNATCLQLADGIVDVNVIFFLLHELPHELKLKALAEAGRVLTPGGKLMLAEFHRPDMSLLRVLSWTYFKVFEPLGLTLWNTHDPISCLKKMGGWVCERTTYLFGNFQVVIATRN
ncbi:MAG: class I SAM-dependent methyltransferase [Burkholderiaceae bacterium]